MFCISARLCSHHDYYEVIILKMSVILKEECSIPRDSHMSTGATDPVGSLGLGRGLGKAWTSSYTIIKPSVELN